jgi:signal transduction histidine kinase
MEDKEQSLYLKEISAHRRRVKYILFVVTLLEIIPVLVVPLPMFTLHKTAIILCLTFAAIYQIIYWKILVPKVIKNATGILILSSPYTILFTIATYYSEGFLVPTALILPITTIIVFNSTQLIILTAIQIAVINTLLLIDIISGTSTSSLIKSTIVLNTVIISTGIIAAITTFEVKEREARMVRLEELDHIKTTFIAIISHNLRTPITAITGFLGILDMQKSSIDQKIGEILIGIKQSTQTLSSLIENTVTISEFQTGQVYLKFEPVQLTLFITQIVHQKFEKTAEEKNLKLKLITPIEQQESIEIDADKKQLETAIANIIDNAIKFTTQGEIKIELERRGTEALIKVADTGMGIPDDYKQHLFSQFNRSGDILIYDQKGVGLGLYITKLIIEAHHGKIWFESQADKGTTFFISLPLKQIPQDIKEKKGADERREGARLLDRGGDNK